MKPRTIAQWMLDKERNETPAGRRNRAGIPSAFHGLTWNDLEDDTLVLTGPKETRSAKEMLQSYAQDWEAVRADADGLVLLGAPGWGKSLGASLVAMDIIDQGAMVRFVTLADLVDRETTLFGKAKEAERENDWADYDREELRLTRIKWDCDLLVLDDCGKERRSASDLAADLFDRIVRRRVNDGKCTILTSNLSLSEWSTYNASMESFLYEVGDVLEYVEGRDHRPVRERPTRQARRAAR